MVQFSRTRSLKKTGKLAFLSFKGSGGEHDNFTSYSVRNYLPAVAITTNQLCGGFLVIFAVMHRNLYITVCLCMHV